MENLIIENKGDQMILKLNKKGLPNLVYVSIIGLAHKDEIRLTKPPWVLQKIIYKILAPFEKLMGYRAELNL